MTRPLAHIVSAQDTAEALGVSRSQLSHLARKHGIGQKIGRDWLFTLEDIEQLRAIRARFHPGHVIARQGQRRLYVVEDGEQVRPYAVENEDTERRLLARYPAARRIGYEGMRRLIGKHPKRKHVDAWVSATLDELDHPA